MDQLVRTITGNFWLLSFFGGTSLVLAGLSAYYAVRQARHDLQRQSQWIRSTIGWFKGNSVLLLILLSAIFAVASWVLISQSLTQDQQGTANPPQTASQPNQASAAITPTETITPTATPLPEIIAMNQESVTMEPVVIQPTETATVPPIRPTVEFKGSWVDPCVDLSWKINPEGSFESATFQGGQAQIEETRRVCSTPSSTPEPFLLTVKLLDSTTEVYTATVVTPIPATATATPTAPYIRFSQPEGKVWLYESPIDGIDGVATLINSDLVSQLKVDAQSSDGRWYRICCFNFNGEDDRSLWLNDPDIIANKSATTGIMPIVVPTPLPPLPFDRTIGPEYHSTGGELLRILVKVYVGDGDPLPGYLIKVRFLPKGQNQWINCSNTSPQQNANGDPTSQTQYVTTPGAVYNYKYEFQSPGAPLGEGKWEFWLSNAEHEQLSEKVPFDMNPGNPNREIYVGWKRR